MAIASSSLTLRRLSAPSKLTSLHQITPIPHKPHLKFPSIPNLPRPLFISNLQNPKPKKPRWKNPEIRSLFTGIVEEMGQVTHLGYAQDVGFEMKIRARTVIEDVKLGDSISVNGTCLTVAEFDKERSEFRVELAPETLRKTSLVELEKGSYVNLERAVLASTRMGGHFVQGHVDGTGEIVSLDPEGDSLWVKVKTTPQLLKYIVPKGFIAVDGTSLTVVDVFDNEESFNFMLVAYTQQNVVIPLKKIGQKVNLEVDILGKYVERILGSGFLSSIKSS
ncbi:hypothetical protein Droror1_Dr00003947 [Drosera rotundifolia]